MAKDPSSIVRRPAPPVSSSRPVVTPIYPSVVYASDDASALDDQYEGRAEGYTYAREGHPNADMLARKLDMLEGCTGGIVTGSGMSAIGAVYLGLLKAGDHVVAGDQLYGRNLRLLDEDLPRMGIAVDLADPTLPDSIAAAMRPETRLVIIETLSNPTLRVADIARLAEIAHGSGALLFVDNTFSTPAMVKPFDLGADIVMHSVTKLLAGHSDVTLGYVAAQDATLMEAMRTAVVTWGLTPSPFDCWLAERGLQSFDLRFARAQENAAALAGAIAGCDGVTSVLYPTRADHPDAGLAARQFGRQGGNMVSFTLDGDRATVDRFLRAMGGIPFGPTLGDIGTIISHPASSSHRALPSQQREALGIPEAFFRVSVGIEDADLLIGEVTGAIRKAMA